MFRAQRRRIRGITPAPLRAAVRLQNASTMQTVHSTATGHGSPREMQHQLTYAPVWKSQRGDAIHLEGRLQTSREKYECWMEIERYQATRKGEESRRWRAERTEEEG